MHNKGSKTYRHYVFLQDMKIVHYRWPGFVSVWSSFSVYHLDEHLELLLEPHFHNKNSASVLDQPDDFPRLQRLI